MKNHKIRVTVNVTDEDIENILSSAFQGIMYWCDEAYIRGCVLKKDEGIFTSQALTHGYRIAIHDSEEDKYHQLTTKKILNGIALYGKYNFDDWDIYDADSVVQLAIFGKQVYG